MTADRPPSFEQRLRTVVASERAPARLRAYFAAPSESGVIPTRGAASSTSEAAATGPRS